MRVLVTGAAGFIGSRIVEELHAAGHDVVPVVRSARLEGRGAVVGDLREFDLQPHVDASDVVVHAATVTSGTADDLWAGNAGTTRRVADAAARAGARLLYLSTTGVYGRSFGTFGDPLRIPRRPGSPLSVARAAAEDLVFDVGGSVIRPHVVHGPGDRWVVPKLAGFMLARNAWLGGPDVQVAAVSTASLARGIVALLDRQVLPRALHAADPSPTPVADLVRPYFLAAGRRLPRVALSVDEAMEALGPLGLSRNALSMLGRSSRMVTDEFWGRTSSSSGAVPTRADDSFAVGRNRRVTPAIVAAMTRT